jgi:hypothetical protein
MIAQLFSRRIVSFDAEARVAQIVCWIAFILAPALIIPRLAAMELTEWQLLMTVIAGSSLMLLLVALSFLFAALRKLVRFADKGAQTVNAA